MRANNLIGKLAIRTAPASGDYSYTDTPIQIVNATASHVAYRSVPGSLDEKILGKDIRVLNARWCDDNWTNYDALVNPARTLLRRVLSLFRRLACKIFK